MDDVLVTIEGEAFGLRLMTAGDRSAVFATWLPSARDVVRETKHVAYDVFQIDYPLFVESLLDTARTVVLYRPEAPHVVHAWACAGGVDVLHWAYVPFKLRGVGLGRTVMTAALGGYPRRIRLTTKFGKHDRGRFVFSPFVVGARLNEGRPSPVRHVRDAAGFAEPDGVTRREAL